MKMSLGDVRWTHSIKYRPLWREWYAPMEGSKLAKVSAGCGQSSGSHTIEKSNKFKGNK